MAEITNKLSHSAVSRYLKCPQSYKYHYVDKIRPTVTSSALLFGSALDAVVEQLLKDHNADYMTTFFANWSEGFISKKKVSLATNTDIVYAERDMDWSLLTDEDLAALSNFITLNKLEYIGSGPAIVYDKCSDFKKQKAYREFRQKEHEYYNYANWLCMARKAPLMVESFKKNILPRIVQVHSTQKQIKLENEEGDTAQGFIDMVVTLDDGKKYVLDLKTSARKYDENAANESPQLSLYAFHEGIEDVGFVVIYKNIEKNKTRKCLSCGTVEQNNRVKTCSNLIKGSRCGGTLGETITPEAKIDLILGKVNQDYTKAVLDNFDVVNNLVKQGIYYKNLDTCRNFYGGDCPYVNLCFGGCTKGLVDENS